MLRSESSCAPSTPDDLRRAMHRGINWIEHTTGLSEPEWLSARGESIKVNFASGDEDPNPRFGPRLQVSGKGMAWNAGCFAVWPLSELETCAYGSETPSTETPATDADDGDGPVVEIMFRFTERGLHSLYGKRPPRSGSFGTSGFGRGVARAA